MGGKVPRQLSINQETTSIQATFVHHSRKSLNLSRYYGFRLFPKLVWMSFYGFPRILSMKKTCRTKALAKSIPIVPVIRLLGSNTSIFSSKSRAPGAVLGNLAKNCCRGYCGSCLTYLRALSLRRNPRLASSGEPMSFRKSKTSTFQNQN